MSETPGTRQWRCYDCGTMIETQGEDGPVCPNGHLSTRIVPLDSPDADEMLSNLDAYNIKKAQEASAAQTAVDPQIAVDTTPPVEAVVTPAATPAAQTAADAAGIDVAGVTGTGADDKVLVSDVADHVTQSESTEG